MEQSIHHPHEQLQAIETAQFRMKLWLALPLGVLAIGVMTVPLRALIVPTLIIVVVLAKGAREYRALQEKKLALHEGLAAGLIDR